MEEQKHIEGLNRISRELYNLEQQAMPLQEQINNKIEYLRKFGYGMGYYPVGLDWRKESELPKIKSTNCPKWIMPFLMASYYNGK